MKIKQIDDFQTGVSNNADVLANTAKVTNATHTGDVTGDTALTISAGAVDIPMLSATGTPDSTTYLRGDNTWGAVTDNTLAEVSSASTDAAKSTYTMTSAINPKFVDTLGNNLLNFDEASGWVGFSTTSTGFVNGGGFVVGGEANDPYSTIDTYESKIIFEPAKFGAIAIGLRTVGWNAADLGTGSVAMGLNAVASGSTSVAINGTATDVNSVAIGNSSVADGLQSVAMNGANVDVNSEYSLLIGEGSKAINSTFTTCIGSANEATDSVGINFIGDFNNAINGCLRSSIIGSRNGTISGLYGGNIDNCDYCSFIGHRNFGTNGEFGVIIGTLNEINSYTGIAIGTFSQANGFGSIAIGSGNNTVTTGNYPEVDVPTIASGQFSIAIGKGINNSTASTIEMGYADATKLSYNATGDLNVGNSVSITGGLSTEFLKADGSVDTSTYLTSYTETDTLQSVTTRGAITTTDIEALSFTKTGGLSTEFLKADGTVDSSTYLTSYTETQTFADISLLSTDTAKSLYTMTTGVDVEFEDSTNATLLYLDESTGNVGIGTATPNSKAQIEGSFAKSYVAKTGTYTITEEDYLIDCTANSFTLTLPTAVGITGREYRIKNSGTGTITVDGNGTETIDGGLTADLTEQYESITVVSTGSNWIVV